MTKRSSAGRADVGIGPYGGKTAGRDDVGFGPCGEKAAELPEEGSGPGRENEQQLSTPEYGAPGSPVAGMRRIRSDAELPREVLDYVELVESDEPRRCKDQLALAAYVRRTFRTEEIYIDTERLGKYLSLQRYFSFDLFPWQKFLVALWLCTFAPDGFPRWDTLRDMQSRNEDQKGEEHVKTDKEEGPE